MQRNLLAGILADQTEAIENITNLDLSVETSTLAAAPPVATSDQTSNAITVSLSNIQAEQVYIYFVPRICFIKTIICLSLAYLNLLQ